MECNDAWKDARKGVRKGAWKDAWKDVRKGARKGAWKDAQKDVWNSTTRGKLHGVFRDMCYWDVERSMVQPIP